VLHSCGQKLNYIRQNNYVKYVSLLVWFRLTEQENEKEKYKRINRKSKKSKLSIFGRKVQKKNSIKETLLNL
jgi:hypothetical protein